MIIIAEPSVISRLSAVSINIHPEMNQKIEMQIRRALITSSGTMPLLSYSIYYTVQRLCLWITYRIPKNMVAASRI
jgi:hypothetical protein